MLECEPLSGRGSGVCHVSTFIYEILVKENEFKVAVGLSTGSDPTWIIHGAEGASIG